MRTLIGVSWVWIVAGCAPSGSRSVETPGWPTVDDTHRASVFAPGEAPVSVVLDADLTNEIDDEYAVIWALLSDEAVRVEAIHAVPHSIGPHILETGLSDLGLRSLDAQLEALGLEREDVPYRDPADGMASAHAEALRIVALVGSDVPAFRGSDRFLPDGETPVTSDAANDLIERARGSEEPLYIVSLGALTNVASALLLAPDIVDDVVVVWTSAYPSFYPYPNKSFNLAQDVAAAQVVLESGVPLVYVPGFYVGEKLRTTRAEIDAQLEGRGPIGEYLHREYAGQPLFGERPGRSKVLWDLAAVAWLVERDWLVTDAVGTPRIDEQLRWVPDARAPAMLEARDLDRDAIFGDLFTKVHARAE